MQNDKKPFKIEDIPKKDVFKVPERYFGSLEDNILKKVEGKRSGRVIRMETTLRWIGYVAAASVLLALMWVASLRIETKASAEDMLAEVSSEDLIAYLATDDEIIDFNLDVMLDDERVMEMDAMIPEVDESLEDQLFELYGILPDDTL
jgi:hypothetical protein